MDNVSEILQTIYIGAVVATFLFNTGRITKAIDIFNECLVLLNGKALRKIKEHTTPRVIYVYHKLLDGYTLMCDHTRAIECGKKLHVTLQNSGQNEEEGIILLKLANIYYQTSKYEEAKQFYKKALSIMIETGNYLGVGICYENLGTVFQSLGQYTKAEEFLQKTLVIKKEIDDKKEEASDYEILGTFFLFFCQYTKAEENLQKALVIRKEIGDKEGEASAYGNLGTVFKSVGQYTKAEEYLQKALVIRKEIGDKEGEAADYGNLGTVFKSVGQYTKAKEYLQKALVISKEIGDKKEEVSAYGNLGTVFRFVGQYKKAQEYLHKALAISKEIGDKEGEASAYLNLGELCRKFQLNAKSQEFVNKALEISYEIGDIEMQFHSHLAIAMNALVAGGSITEVLRNLYEGIQKCEEMHESLMAKDQFKISFFDEHVSPYLLLCRLLIASGSYYEALYVAELGRSRALADILSDKYSVEKEVSVNPQSWIGIENIMDKNSLSSCLYVSCFGDNMYFWILKPNKSVVFRQTKLKESADQVFGNEKIGGSRELRQEQCEDRSLFSSYESSLAKCHAPQEGCTATLRLVEEDKDTPSLVDGYNMIVTPVADLLEEPEIIIIPDPLLYRIPFAALTNDKVKEETKYLSDTQRIRIVPSLTTLKLIQLSSPDYHSETGALIVGDPEVRAVYYQGELQELDPLPWARKEAQMIGRLLGVKPLVGNDARKQTVLEKMPSVSLIHLAAHGDAERGEIALSPISSCGTPHEEDYLLTMAEISKVRLTAKLVVLSCCHSASGQIRAEGVVGIARAFLASGARAVLAALWAIEDEATMQFMNRFYEHLVHGGSASESLHQAMKWMRENNFSDVRQWAPFMLIGDDVSFKGLYLIPFYVFFLAILSQNL